MIRARPYGKQALANMLNASTLDLQRLREKIEQQAAELERLRAQVAELERLVTVQSDNLQRYAAFEATWNHRQAEVRAERDDLAANLKAAQAELDDLRIREE